MSKAMTTSINKMQQQQVLTKEVFCLQITNFRREIILSL